MARSYRVAKYGGRTGADRLSAGRGGRGSLKIPTGTPRLRVDMNWEEAQEKTAHQARVRALVAAGYDPKILANMSPEATARLHAQQAKAPILEKQKEQEIKDAETIGKFFQDVGRARHGTFGGTDLSGESGVGEGHGEVTGEAAGDWADRALVADEGGVFPENLSETLVDEPDPAAIPEGIFDPIDALKPKGKPVDVIGDLFQGLPSRLVTKEIAGAVRQAKKDVAPTAVDEDLLKRSYNLTITKDDGLKYNQRYTAMGEKIGKAVLLGPDDYKAEDGYLNGKPGTFYRNDETREWLLDKNGNPKFFPFPPGFDKRAPKDSGDLNIKFSTFLEANDQYHDLLPWMADKKKGVVAYDPVKWYMTGTDDQRKSVVDFMGKERDNMIAMINALTKLVEAKNRQGQGISGVDPVELQKALKKLRGK